MSSTVPDPSQKEDDDATMLLSLEEDEAGRLAEGLWLRGRRIAAASLSSLHIAMVEASSSIEEGIPCTTFSLVTRPWSSEGEELPPSTLFATTTTTSSFNSNNNDAVMDRMRVAHEREKAAGRDSVAQHRAPALGTSRIAPAPQIQRLLAAAESADAPRTIAPPVLPLHSSNGGVVTTAAQFFAQSSEDGGGQKKSEEGKKSADNDKKTKREEGKENHKKKNSTEPQSRALPQKKKELQPGVGSVDDFLGDMDDDDEDDDEMMLEEEEEASIPVAAAPPPFVSTHASPSSPPQKEAAPRRKRRPAATESEGGAMDAFVSHKPPSATNPGKAAGRKVLVEQTTVDAKGYLRTVQTHVWQSDDDATAAGKATTQEKATTQATLKKATPAPRPPAKKAPALKQGNLMGFFAKK